MINKIVASATEALADIRDGATVMIGGFGTAGQPNELIDALIATGVFIWMLRENARGDILGLGMVLGGALGNIYDRLMFGYVIDYADLHFGDFRPFLIFNIADAAITGGVILILIFQKRFFKEDEEVDAEELKSKADTEVIEDLGAVVVSTDKDTPLH